MDEENIKKLKEIFDALPESIQELLMSSDYQNTLIELVKNYELSVEQAGLLEQETTLVLMGLTPPDNFADELTKELKIDIVKAAQIATEIKEKIFTQVSTLIKLMNTPPGEDPVVPEDEEGQVPTPYYAAGVSTPVAPAQNIAQPAPAKTNDQVLNSAGIEIIPTIEEKPIVETAPIENRAEILSKVEKPDNVQHAPVVSTPPASVYAAPAAAPAAPAGPKVDPYRMPIE